MFYFEEINGYKVLKSDLGLNVGLNHCFTTRRLNMSQVKTVIPNLFRNLTNLEVKKQDYKTLKRVQGDIKIISPQQTHSDHVEIVDERIEYPDTDGLIITQKNIPIALKFADCTPLIFYDTKQKIGAISHAGWRGTVQKIGPKTIEKMSVNFGTQPQDIITIIGPAIGLCCYEVSDEVRGKLLETVKDISGLVQGRNIDLKGINKRQLEEIGVNKIDVCPYCTSCNNDLFYSYRKENGTEKRHYAILIL